MSICRVYANIIMKVHYDIDVDDIEEAAKIVQGYYDIGVAEEEADHDEMEFEIVDVYIEELE